MRRREQEITDPAELRRILREARVCRLAMSDAGGPYLVPLTFALDGDDLILHSARAGRKIEALRRSPAVCFEVEEGVEVAPAATACDFSMRFRTVIGFGDVEFVEDRAERARLLALFAPRYGAPGDPLPEVEIQRTCVLRVRVRELSGKCSPAPGDAP
jgi:nitroimidazol reductase NimA-like FMN-containing flavoprotein (pyridoxamine 5'-phosphate oxidase superfamily)